MCITRTGLFSPMRARATHTQHYYNARSNKNTYMVEIVGKTFTSFYPNLDELLLIEHSLLQLLFAIYEAHNKVE